MSETKVYDLEDRTLEFAQSVRAFVRRLKKDIANIDEYFWRDTEEIHVGFQCIENWDL